MATKVIDVLIRRPAYADATKLVLTAYSATDVIKIPRRIPYNNIKNLATLQNDGFFRGANVVVSSELGGDSTKNADTNLGLTLPRTEKLVLLVATGGTDETTIVVSGNHNTGHADHNIVLPAGTKGDLYEVDLFDLGFLFKENGDVTFTTNKAIDALLIARY